jgi:ABC-2 type transport system permease protein
MKPILLIARRELAAYLRTMTGYVIIAIVLLCEGILFQVFALGSGERRSSEVLTQFFYYASGLTMVSSIIISMRLLAEERQSGTLQLLYSSPITDSEIVLGKFLSAVGFLAIMTLGTVYMPLLVWVNGKISIGHMAAGYLGLMLLGSASLAIGTFGSALARSQVVAVIISGALMLAMVAAWALGRVTDRPLSEVFAALALWPHFQGFQSGMVHLKDIVYYSAVTYVALFASTRVLEARRWK